MCKNIELFDEYTAKVFARLYQTFPVPQDFTILDFIERDEMSEFGTIVNAEGKASPFADVAWHTFIWLKETGFIKIEGEHPYLAFTGIVLTAKGLEVLKSTPNSLQPTLRLGNELIGLLKKGASEAAKQLVDQAIKLGTS